MIEIKFENALTAARFGLLGKDALRVLDLMRRTDKPHIMHADDGAPITIIPPQDTREEHHETGA